MNYCNGVRIQNIGFQTLDTLYTAGLLNHGIRDLYKLRKKIKKMEVLDGFGSLKSRKIVSEIEAKRRLRDYEFFGSLGIEGLNIKTFQLIFANIPLVEFIGILTNKKFKELELKLMGINGIGPIKAKDLCDYLSIAKNRNEIFKILEEVHLYGTYQMDGRVLQRVVFSGCRPDDILIKKLETKGFQASSSWSNAAKCLVIPNHDYESNKVMKAINKHVPILTLDELYQRLEMEK